MLEENENPLAEFRVSSNKTTTTAENLSVNEIEQAIAVAPGEGKTPLSIVGDRFCEELVHPHLFLTGKFDCQVAREAKLSLANILTIDY